MKVMRNVGQNVAIGQTNQGKAGQKEPLPVVVGIQWKSLYSMM